MPKRSSTASGAKDAKAKRISLDELLESQARPALRGTVEAVEGKPEAVKITPWAPGVGCLCHMALAIPRAAINTVTMTEETHFCCGKILHVVEIDFAEDAAIPFHDLFNQIRLSAASAVDRIGHAVPRGRRLLRQLGMRTEATGDHNVPFLADDWRT